MIFRLFGSSAPFSFLTSVEDICWEFTVYAASPRSIRAGRYDLFSQYEGGHIKAIGLGFMFVHMLGTSTGTELKEPLGAMVGNFDGT